MSTALRRHLSHYWFATQDVLFSKLLEKAGPLTKHHEQLTSVIEFARIDNLLHQTLWLRWQTKRRSTRYFQSLFYLFGVNLTPRKLTLALFMHPYHAFKHGNRV